MSRHIAGYRRWTRRARRLLLLIIISGYFCTASYNVDRCRRAQRAYPGPLIILTSLDNARIYPEKTRDYAQTR